MGESLTSPGWHAAPPLAGLMSLGMQAPTVPLQRALPPASPSQSLGAVRRSQKLVSL